MKKIFLFAFVMTAASFAHGLPQCDSIRGLTCDFQYLSRGEIVLLATATSAFNLENEDEPTLATCSANISVQNPQAPQLVMRISSVEVKSTGAFKTLAFATQVLTDANGSPNHAFSNVNEEYLTANRATNLGELHFAQPVKISGAMIDGALIRCTVQR